MIKINTVTIHYAANTTECGCQITLSTPFGETVVSENVAIPSDQLPDDWTDVDLCQWVATSLGVLLNDVVVATPDIVVPPVADPV